MESELNVEYVTNYSHNETSRVCVTNGMSKEECRGSIFF